MAKYNQDFKEGEQVKLISGGPVMQVKKVLINTCSNTPGAVLCEVWDADANQYLVKDYKPEDLKVNNSPATAY